MNRKSIERLIREALRERAVEITNTAPMQASFGQKEGRVRSFLRRVGAKLQRVKEHVRKNKGKYLLAGAVGAAGAAMLHRAAKIESPQYSKFVKKHTGGFMNKLSGAAAAAGERLAPHFEAYAKDARWAKRKLKPILRTAAKYPRATMLLGALGAERLHRAAYRGSKTYKELADSVTKRAKAFIDDSPILSTASATFQDRLGGRLGSSAARAIGTQVDDAMFDTANYGYQVLRGVENPLKGLGKGGSPRRAVRATAAKPKRKKGGTKK